MKIHMMITCLILVCLSAAISSELKAYSPIIVNNMDKVQFTLSKDSNYIIYQYYNEVPNSTYDTVFRLYDVPTYGSYIYLYYSSTENSGVISQDSTGAFTGYFYSQNLLQMSTMEVVLNGTLYSDYNKAGYFYIVIQLTSNSEEAVYSSYFTPFNTYTKLDLDLDKLNHYHYNGFYTNNITYRIPKSNTKPIFHFGASGKNLNIYYCKFNIYTLTSTSPYLSFVGNSINGKTTQIPINTELELVLFYKINTVCEYHLIMDLSSENITKVEEGVVYEHSSVNANDYGYYFIDISKINAKDRIYFNIYHPSSTRNLYYMQITSNDDDYIRANYNTFSLNTVSGNYLKNSKASGYEYYSIVKTSASYNGMPFRIIGDYSTYSFPSILFQNFGFNEINSEFTKSFKSKEVAYYYINLTTFYNDYPNKNIMIYSNKDNTLNIYEEYVIITDSGRYTPIDNRKLFHVNVRNYIANKKYCITIIGFNAEEDFNLQIKYVSNDIKFKNMEYTGKYEQITKNYLDNSNGTYVYFINYYKSSNSQNNNITYYKKIYGDFDIKIVNLEEYTSDTLDGLFNEDYSLKESTLVKDGFTPNKYNTQQELIYIYKKSSYVSYYLQTFNCDSKNGDTISRGEYAMICLGPNEKTEINLERNGAFNYEIELAGNKNEKISSNIDVSVKVETKSFKFSKFGQIYRDSGEGSLTATSNLSIENKCDFIIVINFKKAISKESISNIIMSSVNGTTNTTEGFYVYGVRKDIDTNYKSVYQKISTYIYSSNLSPSTVCIYQEYGDINYLSYPPNLACFSQSQDFQQEMYINDIYPSLYSETNEDNDYLYLLIYIKKVQNTVRVTITNILIGEIKDDSLEGQEISLDNNNDILYLYLPEWKASKNYDSVAVQIFTNNPNTYNYYTYVDLQVNNITTYSRLSKYNQKFLGNDELLTSSCRLFITSTIGQIIKFIMYNSNDKEFENYQFSYTDNLYPSIQINNTHDPVKINAKIRAFESNMVANYTFILVNASYYVSDYFKIYKNLKNIIQNKEYVYMETFGNISSTSKTITSDGFILTIPKLTNKTNYFLAIYAEQLIKTRFYYIYTPSKFLYQYIYNKPKELSGFEKFIVFIDILITIGVIFVVSYTELVHHNKKYEIHWENLKIYKFLFGEAKSIENNNQDNTYGNEEALDKEDSPETMKNVQKIPLVEK